LPDVVLTGGLLDGGSGSEPRRADVVIRDGRISDVVDSGLPTGPGRMPLGEAIRKVIAAPADRVGLSDRGRIRPGLVADLLVLDVKSLADAATYADPARYPRGIDLVMVGGQAVIGRTEQA
jgi:N-acyl-D-aspartate/D-glutamate deacylase